MTGESSLTLERYGEWAKDDETHVACHHHMTEFFRARRFGREVLEPQLAFFEELLGPDLNIQRMPYLRITRPGQRSDNLDFHRDTAYGHTPFELSVLVPYVDVPEESSLSLLSGSHVRAEKEFPMTQTVSPDVTKGSIKNQLGFLYAPKCISPELTAEATPVALKVGEVLIFSQATIHGSRINAGATTRWTSDTRIVNALVSLRPELKTGYYEPLRRSAVTEFAERYYSAQAEESRV